MENNEKPNGKELFIQHYGDRYFALYEGEDLVCITVYKKGAIEVKRRLEAMQALIASGGEEDGIPANQQGSQ